MRWLALALSVSMAACTGVPPEGTPYFESTTSGDNLYPAVSTRIYATDQRVETQAPHPLNRNRGKQTVRAVPGAFAEGLAALETLPPPSGAAVTGFIASPDECCHLSFDRTFIYCDGNQTRGITEAVWRRAAAIPPFVDEPLRAE